MELCLGRFGDRRLEKGGPFFWPVLLGCKAGSCGCGGWGVIGPERFA